MDLIVGCAYVIGVMAVICMTIAAVILIFAGLCKFIAYVANAY